MLVSLRKNAIGDSLTWFKSLMRESRSWVATRSSALDIRQAAGKTAQGVDFAGTRRAWASSKTVTKLVVVASEEISGSDSNIMHVLTACTASRNVINAGTKQFWSSSTMPTSFNSASAAKQSEWVLNMVVSLCRCIVSCVTANCALAVAVLAYQVYFFMATWWSGLHVHL